MNATRMFLVMALVAGGVAGCGEWFSPQQNGSAGITATGSASTSKPPAVSNPPSPAYLRETAVKGDNGETGAAVDDAMRLSEKYSKLAEELVRVQQAKLQAEEHNRTQAEEQAKLRGELEQYKKELNEANAMLMDMRQELDKWKTNVLGFRDEMRKAQTAQIDALRKILELLGGEAPRHAAAAPTTQPSNNAVSAARETSREMANESQSH